MNKEDKYLNETEETEETEEIDVLDKLEVENLIRETKEFLDDDELNEMAIQAAGWGKKSVEKFGKTIGKSPKEHGFFDACVSRMKGKSGWDKEKANGFCARLIDTAKGSTSWRGKNEERIVEAKSLDDIVKLYIDMLAGKPVLPDARDAIKKIYKEKGDSAIRAIADAVKKQTKGKYKPKVALEDLYIWSYGKPQPQKFQGKHGTKWMRDK